MSKYSIEQDDETGRWNLLMLCGDGIYDILSDHATRQAAKVELNSQIDNDWACVSAERRYQEQYAHACGYYD